MTGQEPDAVWDVRGLVADSVPASGLPWSEVFRALRMDTTSEARVSALAGDMAMRGSVGVPVKVVRPRTASGVMRVVDGVHRVAAAWSVLMPVPVIYVPEGTRPGAPCACAFCADEVPG